MLIFSRTAVLMRWFVEERLTQRPKRDQKIFLTVDERQNGAPFTPLFLAGFSRRAKGSPFPPTAPDPFPAVVFLTPVFSVTTGAVPAAD